MPAGKPENAFGSVSSFGGGSRAGGFRGTTPVGRGGGSSVGRTAGRVSKTAGNKLAKNAFRKNNLGDVSRAAKTLRDPVAKKAFDKRAKREISSKYPVVRSGGQRMVKPSAAGKRATAKYGNKINKMPKG